MQFAPVEWFNRFSLAQKFSLTSLLVLVLSGLALGWWVGREIERGVIHRSAATTALYVENFLRPQLQELGRNEMLSSETFKNLDGLLEQTSLGEQIVRFRVWGRGGLVLYSTNITHVGRRFPVEEGLALAWQKGEVSSEVTDLSRAENADETKPRPNLIETYVPIREEGSDRVVAVVEFYALMDDLERDIAAARTRSWLVVGAVTLATYLLLIGIVRRGSDTITRQQAELNKKLVELNTLLAQNTELNTRVRRAATRTTALNERFLRRVSSELHDGPAQDLSYALLRLDGVASRAGNTDLNEVQKIQLENDLGAMEQSLVRSINEIRTISRGLYLPELEGLSLREAVERAVRQHENRTRTDVTVALETIEEPVALPVKITAFRLVQEALNNAFRHAGGAGQSVRLNRTCPKTFTLEIADAGPGFDWDGQHPFHDRLGLMGMRERVESLGGNLQIESRTGEDAQHGALIRARIPFQPEGD